MITKEQIIIGLTGPMCAGKNIAATILGKKGFAVVDADKVAHQALEDIKEAVLTAFGEKAKSEGQEILSSDGKINRKALAHILFANPDLLAKHESIIYPRINFLLEEFINLHPNENIVINAPLLYKSPVIEKCSFVIFIDSYILFRLFRAIKRDKLPIMQIFARFFTQKNLFAQYIKKDVDILRVHNRGSIRVLEKKLAKLLILKGY